MVSASLVLSLELGVVVLAWSNLGSRVSFGVFWLFVDDLECLCGLSAFG